MADKKVKREGWKIRRARGREGGRGDRSKSLMLKIKHKKVF